MNCCYNFFSLSCSTFYDQWHAHRWVFNDILLCVQRVCVSAARLGSSSILSSTAKRKKKCYIKLTHISMLSNHEFLSPIKCFFPVRPKIQKKTCWSGQQKKAIKLIFTFYFRSIELPIESASRLFPLPFTFSSSRALLPPRHSPCMLQCYTTIFMRSHEQVSLEHVSSAQLLKIHAVCEKRSWQSRKRSSNFHQ